MCPRVAPAAVVKSPPTYRRVPSALARMTSPWALSPGLVAKVVTRAPVESR